MIQTNDDAERENVPAQKSRATRWMMVVGVIAVSLALLCWLATVGGMVGAYGSIADSGSSGLSPAELAGRISTAAIPSRAAGPLAIIGIAFLVLGLLRRQPVPPA